MLRSTEQLAAIEVPDLLYEQLHKAIRPIRKLLCMRLRGEPEDVVWPATTVRLEVRQQKPVSFETGHMLSNGDGSQIQGGGEFVDAMAAVTLQERQNVRFRIVHIANLATPDAEVYPT